MPLKEKQHEKVIEATRLQPQVRPIRETIIPHGYDPKLVMCSAPGSIDAENFKALKSQILFKWPDSKPRTIMVTSALPGEGKTFVATNLAACFAQGVNEHALLIDCDLHRPTLHKMLGYSNAEGLQEYLSGKRELKDLLIRTRIDKLTLLTAGGHCPNPSELLSSSRMKTFFDEVKERYPDRYIIVDGAPGFIMSEISVLANYVDGLIFVVRAHKSPRETIKECIEKLGKEKILGIVFNDYDKTSDNYGTYYKNYYKRKR